MATLWRTALVLAFAHFVVSQAQNQCREPLQYPGMWLDDKYLGKSVFNNQERVLYKCVQGYTRSGGSPKSICDKGRWTPLTMKCQKKNCNALPDIENGEYIQKGRSYGDKAFARCNKGYALRGGRVRVCLDKGWNGTNPICVGLESSMICSAPDVANRWIDPGEMTQYLPQDSLPISCSEGFDLIGSPVVTCGPDGQWQDLPECRPAVLKIICSAPAVENRWIKPRERTQYTPRDTVTISCSEGFDLIGPSVVTCGQDGQWQDLPECRPKEIHCSAPTVANGRTHGTIHQYKPRETVTISCGPGFDLIGSTDVTCGPDGQWRGLPECRPKKNAVVGTGKCGPAPSHPKAFLRDGSAVLREYPSGARLRYKCHVGHRRTAGMDSIRCLSGQWTPLRLQCERKSCGSAGEISYGRFEYEGVSFGDSARAVCQDGYELIGPAMRTCRDGGWDGRTPVCEPVHCPPLPEVKNAETSDPTYDHVPLGHVVSYHCRTGALIGERDIYCTQDGTWSAPPPECRDIVCPQPHVPHGSRMRGFRSVYKFGNSVTIACDPGLRLVGQSFVTCGLDGKWTPQLPQCQPWPRRRYH